MGFGVSLKIIKKQRAAGGLQSGFKCSEPVGMLSHPFPTCYVFCDVIKGQREHFKGLGECDFRLIN